MSTLVLAAILLVAGAFAILLPVLMTDAEIAEDAAEYEQFKEQAEVATERAELVTGIAPTLNVPLAPLPDTISPSEVRHTTVDLAACQATNSDFIAWLQIPNTTVDYPVVWSDDVDYYLHHTFQGKKAISALCSRLKQQATAHPARTLPFMTITFAATIR